MKLSICKENKSTIQYFTTNLFASDQSSCRITQKNFLLCVIWLTHSCRLIKQKLQKFISFIHELWSFTYSKLCPSLNTENKYEYNGLMWGNVFPICNWVWAYYTPRQIYLLMPAQNLKFDLTSKLDLIFYFYGRSNDSTAADVCVDLVKGVV